MARWWICCARWTGHLAHLRSKEAELRETYGRLEAELGRPATDAEVAEAMGITLHALNDLTHEVGRWAVISLEESLATDEDGQPLPVGDTIPDDDAVSPEEHAEEENRRACLAEAIDALPDQERTVISLYYHDNLTLKEIGRGESLADMEQAVSAFIDRLTSTADDCRSRLQTERGRTEDLLGRTPSEAHEDSEAAPHPSPQPSRHPALTTYLDAAGPRGTAEVYRLADESLDEATIARETGISRDEVRLMLALRAARS